MTPSSTHAVEPSAAADVLDRMLDETGRNFRPTIHEETAESFFGIDGGAKAVTTTPTSSIWSCSGTSSRSWTTRSQSSRRRSGGSRTTGASSRSRPPTATPPWDSERWSARSRPRDRRRDVLAHAPALAGRDPSDGGWSFDVADDLDIPPFQRRLDETAERGSTDEPGEFVNVDVQFAYAILRPDGKRRVDVQANDGRCARMADSEEHVTDRVNYLAVKLSHDLSDGDNALYRVGDGSQTVDHYLVCTRETVLNDDLRTADYGSVVFVENGLVLWNDDEGAYNVVVDDETVVDLVAP